MENLKHLEFGTQVTLLIKNKDGQKVRMNGIYEKYDKDDCAVINVPELNKKVYRKRVNDIEVVSESQAIAQVTAEAINQTPVLSNKPKFTINQRFSFLANLVKMVINNQAVSAIISGSGGLGKSYTVLNQLEIAGLVEDEDYVIIKGFSTSRGLYNKLYDHSDKLLVFDDCDSVLTDKVAANLLKGALDSYDKRVITWNAQMVPGAERENQFEFTGRIIFISNLSQTALPQALISRSATVDVTMTTAEKIERMETVLPYLSQQTPMEIKEECLNLLKEFKDHAKDLNFRTLLKVIAIREASEVDETMDDWKDMSIYMLCNS